MRTLTPAIAVLMIFFAACKNDTSPPSHVKQYTIEQRYNDNFIFGSGFNSHEKKLLVSTNLTGVRNVYELNVDDTSINPLATLSKKSYYPFDYLPGMKSYLYSADSGGNENSHVVLQNPGETFGKDITPRAAGQNNMFGWSVGKKSMYVSSVGGSYGGCMVLTALAFYPEDFKAGVDLFGVTNWMGTLRSISPYWESVRKALYEQMGHLNTADWVRLKNTSPLFNYKKINKPLIVFAGMNDGRVLPIQSKEINA